MFEFCIKELLTHLHKSAADNIIFCFTNARSTNYRPGDTYPALKKLLDVNRSVPIELKKETVYCMDNESFRYLATIKHGIFFGPEEDKIFSASWDKARLMPQNIIEKCYTNSFLLCFFPRSETDRLMDYVSTLKPHRVKETISVNDVRRRILDLTKPLAEIAKHIDITLSNFKDQKNEISSSQASAEDLKKMINIQARDLTRP